jgi:hypothetical protein
MRVLVTGGRDFSDRTLLFEALDRLHTAHGFTVLIHGDANGADRLSGEWAASKGIKVEVHPADWKKHGRAAGPIRNQKMLEEKPELVVAFPGGKGTADMVRKAKQAGLEVVMVEGE